MAFWSKRLLTPEIVVPISNALCSVPHEFEWSVYDEKIDGEQIIFSGEYAKIHVWANYRDRSGAASIMRPETDGFELSTNVIPLHIFVHYHDLYWEDYVGCFEDQDKKMAFYGDIVQKFAIPYFLNAAQFEPLVQFYRGFCAAYTRYSSGYVR